ncbi:50S ribosomal protein L15 [Candidatus Dependentiae bacterium]|nr:50S ribosomal protein L15 [Candidatus Dependentiae bacterium]
MLLKLSNLKQLVEKRKRVGRGGKRGGVSGRGSEGQKSRTGSHSEIRPSFEGGQMPLLRRIPKRGFKNRFKTEFALVSLDVLENSFEAGQVVDVAALRERGLVKRRRALVKVLCNGELNKKLSVHVHAISEAARVAIQKAGGEVVLLGE